MAWLDRATQSPKKTAFMLGNICVRKLNDSSWLDDDARQEFSALRINAHKQLNAWCETYLDGAQWTAMKNGIRARRKRSNSSPNPVNVALEEDAWSMLRAVARHEDITLSDVIVKHLKKAYEKTLD